MEHVWDYEGYVGDVRAVDVAVRRLREKIEDDPASPKFVVTKRGMGVLLRRLSPETAQGAAEAISQGAEVWCL